MQRESFKEEEMTKTQAIELIEQCLSNIKDDPDSDAAIESYRNIRHADFSVDTVPDYYIDLSKVEIMHMRSCISDDDRWDGEHEAYVVFTFDKGYGLASHRGWWRPTFSSETRVLDVHESHNFEIFDKTCLTAEIRADLKVVFDKEARDILLEDRE